MLAAGEELRIRSLAGMARALSRSGSLTGTLELAAEQALTAIVASSVSISRRVPGTAVVQTIVNVGDLGPDEVRWPEHETYEMRDFVDLELVHDELQTWVTRIEDPEGDQEEIALLRELGKGCSIGAPIVVDGELWGEFWATRHVGAATFDRNDVAHLEVLIAILGGAISRARREESLEQLAYQDPLTGLPNRRALDEHADRVFDVPAGTTREVTVVAVDINRLKEVNDSLGHVAGDHLIQSVGRTLRAAFNRVPGSLVARVGGDEFTILVSGHDPVHVVQLADRLCRRTWRFGHGAGISCGAASTVLTDERTTTPHELFAAADRAQYVAKHGRISSTVLSDEFEPVLGDPR